MGPKSKRGGHGSTNDVPLATGQATPSPYLNVVALTKKEKRLCFTGQLNSEAGLASSLQTAVENSQTFQTPNLNFVACWGRATRACLVHFHFQAAPAS